MSEHTNIEYANLKAMLVRLGRSVSAMLEQALKSLQEHDADLARRVVDDDGWIDRAEVEIELKCQDVLALYQPVAMDLRTVIAALKVNGELERIADQACNVAKQVGFLLRAPTRGPVPADVVQQGRLACQMLALVVNAWEHMNAAQAEQVIQTDRQVDDIHRRLYQQVEQAIHERHERFVEMSCHLKVSRELERIADHCVNIAENILYVQGGKITRHQVA